ncbi:hypothetical protein SAMN05444395_10298 [Flavobacterium fryxellicola]|nr:hypothetical protein SAMN05444395_10298 [Flavobacterium fryxellicola]
MQITSAPILPKNERAKPLQIKKLGQIRNTKFTLKIN